MLNREQVEVTMNGVFFNLIGNLKGVCKHVLTGVCTHLHMHFLTAEKMNVKLVETHHAILAVQVVKALKHIVNSTRLIVGNILLKLSMSVIDKHDFLNDLLVYRRMVAVRSNDDFMTSSVSQFNESLVHTRRIMRHDLYIKVLTKAVTKPLEVFLSNCIVVNLNRLIDESRHASARDNKPLAVLLQNLKVDARLAIVPLIPRNLIEPP